MGMSGSFWLSMPVESKPLVFIPDNDCGVLPDLREKVLYVCMVCMFVVPQNDFSNGFANLSSFLKLRKTLAYVLRFVRNVRPKLGNCNFNSLYVKELNEAKNICICLTQQVV